MQEDIRIITGLDPGMVECDTCKALDMLIMSLAGRRIGYRDVLSTRITHEPFFSQINDFIPRVFSTFQNIGPGKETPFLSNSTVTISVIGSHICYLVI